METNVIIILVGVCTLAVSLVGAGVVAAWTVRGAINGASIKMAEALSAHQRDTSDNFTNVRTEMGEQGHALRSKIQDFEKWSRDEFVRHRDFQLVVNQMKDNSNAMRESLDTSLDKMEQHVIRIEGKVDRDREFDRERTKTT